MDDGLLAIQRAIFLRKAGVETVVDEFFLSNPPARAELLESAIKNIIRWPSSLVCFLCFTHVITAIFFNFPLFCSLSLPSPR